MTATATQQPVPASETMRHPLDLEAWRKREGLTYDALGVMIGVHPATQVTRYAVGARWPDPDLIDRIAAATGGEVTLFALHRRRAAWLRENGGPRRVPSRTIGE